MQPVRLARFVAILLLVPTIAFGQDFSSGQHQERSPFIDVKFEGESAHVLIGDAWYEWLALNGVPYESIRAQSIELDPGGWQRRLAEDLLAVPSTMDVQPGESVRLKLRSLENDAMLTMPAVRMTNDNRNMVWRSRRSSRSAPIHPRPAPSLPSSARPTPNSTLPSST